MRYIVLLAPSASQILSAMLALLLSASSEPVLVQTRVEEAMAKLWSLDDAQRRAGKETLLASGEMAIPPLLSLLDEIMAVPRMRFASGMETAAMRALERLERAKRDGNEGERLEASIDLSRLEITDRLRRDAVDLLVELKAEAAIPRLIALLSPLREIHVVGLGGTVQPPAADALAKLGSVAVPYLLNAISEPDAFISSWEPYTSASNGPGPNYEYLRPILIDRAIRIVGRIGDARAAAVLESLLGNPHYARFSTPISQAIGSIRSRGR